MLPAKTLTLTRRGFFQALINGALLATGAASAIHSAAAARLSKLPKTGLPPISPLETFVAGTVYYNAPEVLHLLVPGERLILARQSNNPYDAAAIEVFTTDGQKLGYVPRAVNPPFADLMDADRKVLAEVIDIDPYRYDDIQLRLTVVS